MEKYIAVTIGPIFDTINLTSFPAALWAASYMFSSLSKNICETLTQKGVAESDIISPKYASDDPLLSRDDGVGLFHDRIVFRAGSFDIKDFNKVKEAALSKTVRQFGFEDKDLDFFRHYFLISAVAYESDNPIADSNLPLDSLELMKPLAFERGDDQTEGKNPILSFFTADGERHKSDRIKEQIGKMGIKNWQLYDNNRNIMSLSEIAANGIPKELKKQFKKYKYYALIRSDGDRMSKIVGQLDTAEKITAFSQTCLSYCAEIADKVKQYGGVTIYSGGDDLLALLPVENGNKETVFDFIQTANRVFAEKFDQMKKTYAITDADVSLSFGVFISYYKFPLYEALERSAELLFGVAKRYRNCAAIRLQKHAGQSQGLLIFNDSLEQYLRLHKAIVKDKADENGEVILSAMHKLSLFKTMFNAAGSFDELQNLFDNTFDADAHRDNSFLKTTLPQFFDSLSPLSVQDGCHIYPITGNEIETDTIDRTQTAESVLRIVKFFTETGGEA